MGCSTLSVPNCHATRRLHEGWDTARLPKPRQGKSRGRGRVRTTDLPTSNILVFAAAMTIQGVTLKLVEQYRYLSRCISRDASVTNEVNSRSSMARIAFASLRHLCRQKDILLGFEGRVYQTAARSWTELDIREGNERYYEIFGCRWCCSSSRYTGKYGHGCTTLKHVSSFLSSMMMMVTESYGSQPISVTFMQSVSIHIDWSVNLLTRRSVVRTPPLPLDFPCLGLGNLAVSQPSCFLRAAARHRKGVTPERFPSSSIAQNDSDSSTSDEEYVPPAKLSKIECDSGDSSEDESSIEVSDDELGCSSGKRHLADEDTSATGPSTCVKEEERKAKEDAIWDDFLSSVENPTATKSTGEYVEVSKKYQFAGEEIKVTERVPVKNDARQGETVSTLERKTVVQDGDSVSDSHSAKKLLSVNSSVKPTTVKSNGLAAALSNLKSLTGNKLPKLSTLEKSRMDWQNFIRKENIEDDLKAHNKGKQGYLERRAFINRTEEREYALLKSQTSRKT
ncbi:Craniofacial development protein 1 [Clonorchis sinensis]|uniref:Craniofacial development protein 1 n=1 Tax=Clonorchis sinensis TaxID=79923 RepID=A0A3R7D0C9_CLOSI|nr:Craniofacial development protein 1 [Clonorchis sinensis]